MGSDMREAALWRGAAQKEEEIGERAAIFIRSFTAKRTRGPRFVAIPALFVSFVPAIRPWLLAKGDRATSRPSEVITRYLDDSVKAFEATSRASCASSDSLAPAVTVIYEGRVPGIRRAASRARSHATRSRGHRRLRRRRDAWKKVRVQAMQSEAAALVDARSSRGCRGGSCETERKRDREKERRREGHVRREREIDFGIFSPRRGWMNRRRFYRIDVRLSAISSNTRTRFSPPLPSSAAPSSRVAFAPDSSCMQYAAYLGFCVQTSRTFLHSNRGEGRWNARFNYNVITSGWI